MKELKKSNQKLVTLKEMAALLNRCERTFRKYVIEYKIPHIRLGRDMLFDAAEVESHLKNLTMEALNSELVHTPAKIIPETKRNAINPNKSKNKYADLLGLS